MTSLRLPLGFLFFIAGALWVFSLSTQNLSLGTHLTPQPLSSNESFTNVAQFSAPLVTSQPTNALNPSHASAETRAQDNEANKPSTAENPTETIAPQTTLIQSNTLAQETEIVNSVPSPNTATLFGYKKVYAPKATKNYFYTSSAKEAEIIKNQRVLNYGNSFEIAKDGTLLELKIEKINFGTKDNLSDFVEAPISVEESLLGPDYKFEDTTDPEQIALLKNKVLTLGHGGWIEIRVANGQIVDKPGIDFVVYENVIHYQGELFQEFAFVEVSNESKGDLNFKRFPCEPQKGILEGCAGFVPTDMGGDGFDLAKLEMKSAKRIRILDTRQNGQGQGFDLDSVKILHGILN